MKRETKHHHAFAFAMSCKYAEWGLKIKQPPNSTFHVRQLLLTKLLVVNNVCIGSIDIYTTHVILHYPQRPHLYYNGNTNTHYIGIWYYFSDEVADPWTIWLNCFPENVVILCRKEASSRVMAATMKPTCAVAMKTITEEDDNDE